MSYSIFHASERHAAAGDTSQVKRRIKSLYLFLAIANLVVWLWALISLRGNSAMIGTALLAYSFGLRHALDADHIAAIDNVTRRLMQDGSRPVTVGFCFAVGHSLVVIIASIAIAAMAKTVTPYLPQLQEYGGLLSSIVSTVFLLAIGLINIVLLMDIYRAFQRMQYGERMSAEQMPAHNGHFFARLFRPLFGNIHNSWQMIPLGFLFGLGFETATEVALLSTSALQASQGMSFGTILLFPLLFTVGMLTVDATDGVLMLRVYGWAFVKPFRKLYYNMMLTLTSTLLALVIAAIGVSSLVQEYFHLNGTFWALIQSLHDNYTSLGYVIIGVFTLSWIGSETFYRLKRYDMIDGSAS
ncbi:MAG TPA: HoxN/HupN/NixA family nickel/cobalt transporter [Herminiimonas sp.]|nr:HoxN/HupN/NixA family nickel/cobalt transporter [Herminiimonas sp.]